MPDPVEMEARVVEDPGCDALTAYAKLRAYTPGRASFLFESRDPSHPDARYSIVGYRVRQGGLMPPNVDAFETLARELDGERPASFAEAVARGTVGYLSASSALMKRGVRLFEDEGPSANVVTTAAVLVYDHREGTFTVAAPKQGDQVERLLHELEHADEPAPTPEVDPEAGPAAVTRWFDADKLAKRHARAKGFFGDEVDELVLAQMYIVKQNGADPFAAYRALREVHDAPFGYFIDFGESPMAPEIQVFGVGRKVLHQHHRDDGDGSPASFSEALHAALPDPSLMGGPVDKAARLLRKIEQNARLVWGGAVGYACPGGEACFVLGDELVFAQSGNFWVNRGTRVTADTDPTTIGESIDAATKPTLAALAAVVNR